MDMTKEMKLAVGHDGEWISHEGFTPGMHPNSRSCVKFNSLTIPVISSYFAEIDAIQSSSL